MSGRGVPEIDLRDHRGPDSGELAGPLLESLQSAYDLGEWLEWWQLRGGPSSTSFFVTTTRGDFVLRRSYDHKNEAGMEFEVKLLGHLRRAGYPAPRVISTGRGNPFYVHFGGHPRVAGRNGSYFLLTEWIPGRAYDPANPAHLREAGRALARYHRAVEDFPARFRPEGRPVLAALEWNGPSLLAAFAEIAERFLDTGGRQRLTRACSYLWSQFIRVPEALAGVQAALPQLVVQASFGRSAVIYDGDSVAGVVGYDRAAYDLRALDLVSALTAFAREEDPAGPQLRAGLDLDLCAGLMAAYAEVEPLGPAELEALPLVFRARRLETVMSTANRFLRRHEAAGVDRESVEKVVDVADAEAERLRWLEQQELAFQDALSSWPAAPVKGHIRKG